MPEFKLIVILIVGIFLFKPRVILTWVRINVRLRTGFTAGRPNFPIP